MKSRYYEFALLCWDLKTNSKQLMFTPVCNVSSTKNILKKFTDLVK